MGRRRFQALGLVSLGFWASVSCGLAAETAKPEGSSDAITAVVTKPGGTIGYSQDAYPKKTPRSLNFGSRIQIREAYGTAYEAVRTRNGMPENIVVFRDHVGVCEPSKNSVLWIQTCLNTVGENAGTPDGIPGPKFKKALDAFFNKNRLDAADFSLACQEALICSLADMSELERGNSELQRAISSSSAFLNSIGSGSSRPIKPKIDPAFRRDLDLALAGRAYREKHSAARAHYDARNCSALDGIEEGIAEAFPMNECQRLKKQELAQVEAARVAQNQRLAGIAFQRLDCERVRFYQTGIVEKYSVSQCLKSKARKENTAELERALATDDCDRAQNLSRELNIGHQEVFECIAKRTKKENIRKYFAAIEGVDCETVEEVGSLLGLTYRKDLINCRKTREVAENRRRYQFAITQNECAEIERLGRVLGVDFGDAFDQCNFNVVLTEGSARKLFLTAAKLDAGDQLGKAKRLYAKLVDKYPEDDLALQAALRLTALNDRENLKKEQRQREEEERKRAEAAARVQRAAQAEERKPSPCDRLYVGMGFHDVAYLLAIPIRSETKRIVGIHRARGVVTAVGTETGVSHERNCSDVP